MTERAYFDAKFDGLARLMQAQQENTTNYIMAVSANVKRLESSISDHKENLTAHGLGEGRRWGDSLAKWGAVVLSAAALLSSAFGRRHQ